MSTSYQTPKTERYFYYNPLDRATLYLYLNMPLNTMPSVLTLYGLPPRGLPTNYRRGAKATYRDKEIKVYMRDGGSIEVFVNNEPTEEWSIKLRGRPKKKRFARY